MLNILKECNFLDNVIGRFDLKKKIENIINADESIPAILLCGDAGIGKHFFAHNIVAHIFSKDLQENNKSSLIIDDFNANYEEILAKMKDSSIQDFHAIAKQDNERTIPIARIREDLKFLPLKPQIYSHVCWLIEISNISEQGQNILLKSLEEAPGYVVFILLADNKSEVLTTIRSRAQTFLMPSLNETELLTLYRQYSDSNMTDTSDAEVIEKNKLNSENVTPESKINSIIRIANGNPGKLFHLLEFENLFEEIKDFIDRFRNFIVSPQGFAVAELYSWINGKYRNECDKLFEIFSYIIHDFNLIKSIDDPALFSKDESLYFLQMSEEYEKADKKNFILGKVYLPFWVNGNYKIVSKIKSRSAFSDSYLYMQEFMNGLEANANFEISLTSTLLKIHEVLSQ